MAEIDLGQVRQSEDKIQELIDESLLTALSGARIEQDAEGNWGYIPPGADAVIPFKTGGGGSIEGVEEILTISTSTVNMPLTTRNLTFNKKYKAVFAVMESHFSSGYPTVTITLPTNSIEATIFQSNYSSIGITVKVAADVNLAAYDVGDIYSVKYRSYYSASTSPPFRVRVYGIY